MLPSAILVDIIGSDNILPEKEKGRSAFISVSLHILESFVSTKTTPTPMCDFTSGLPRLQILYHNLNIIIKNMTFC